MSRLDAVIEKLFKESGVELLFESGAGISLRTTESSTLVMKQKLTSQQIIGALAEILPGDLKSDFPAIGVTTFPYLSPSGAVVVRLENEGDTVRASMAPYGMAVPEPEVEPDAEIIHEFERVEEEPMDDSETIELVSPADLLELAAAHTGGRTSVPEVELAPATRRKFAEAPPAPRKALAAPEPERSIPPAVVVAPRQSAGTQKAKQSMIELLSMMLSRGASDLHLTSGCVPLLRIDGDVAAQTKLPALTSESIEEMLWSIAPKRNYDQWQETKDTDFAFETEKARFRVNAFADRTGIGAVLRQIPNKILSAEEMGLSKSLLDLCLLRKGLVLVTGPTGSGKSTTLAALVDYVNRNRSDHIITIEDPIEFVHPNKRCLVNQREVGVHTGSFKQALRAALREDPDVVLVGELRDLETVAIAIETAETGHLVFGTLHTNTAASTVDRIIDQFPADRQSQIRMMLSESLKAVISQTLCKKLGGGRAPALEVLLCTSSVSNLIREGKTFQIPSIMQTSKAQGMVALNDALFDLVKRRVVDPKEALQKAIAKSELQALLDRAGLTGR